MPISINSPQVTISASTSSGNVAYPPGNTNGVRVTNIGTVAVFVNSGTSNSVTASSANQVVPAGQTVIFEKPEYDTFIAALAATSTATVYITLCGSNG